MSRIKSGIFAVICLAIYLAFFISSSLGEIIQAKDYALIDDLDSDCTFPASLQIIMDDAFNGTNISSAVFNYGLTRIGEHAFSNNENLTDVYIPKTTEIVGNDAFPHNTIIHGPKGSYIESWAKKNGFGFETGFIWLDVIVGERVQKRVYFKVLVFILCSILLIDKEKMIRCLQWIIIFAKSMRPQDRPELYPVDYRFP